MANLSIPLEETARIMMIRTSSILEDLAIQEHSILEDLPTREIQVGHYGALELALTVVVVCDILP